MPTRAIALALGLTLFATPVRGLAAGYEPARATVEVNAAALGEASDVIQDQLRIRGDQVLREADVLPGRSAGDPIMTLTVSALTGDDMGYAVELVLARGDEVLARTSLRCDLCTEAELLDRAAGSMGDLVPAIREAAEQPEPDPGPGPDAEPEPIADPVEGPADNALPAGEPDRPRPLGPLGKAGIGVTVLGVATLAAGIGVALKDPTVKEGSGGTQLEDPARVGYALLGVGGAVLVTGVALVVVDRVKASKGTASRVAPRFVAAPWAVATGGGMAVGGHF